MSADDFSEILARLEQTIAERKRQPGADSYTAKLLAAGGEKIGKKLVEESLESVLAALEPGEPGREHLIREAADVVYHLMVLLAWRDASLAEVAGELRRRFGVSGLAEKAARSSSPTPESNR